MLHQRPDDCPHGLWEVLGGILQNPAEFLQDNPEVYHEIKAVWRSFRRKPPGAVTTQSTKPSIPATESSKALPEKS